MAEKLALYQTDLQNEISADFLKTLSSQERDFAESIRNPALREQHIKVRIAVRQILASYLNQAAEKIAIAKTEYGKPYLVDYPDIHFNISHTGSTLLTAISQLGDIGLDIEQAQQKKRDFSGLVSKCLAQQEQDYWNALAEAEKAAEFYRFWTRKEAFVKAVGRGLALGLQSCVIAGGNNPYFVEIPEHYGQPSDWQLFDLQLKADLYGALVIKTSRLGESFSLPSITIF